MNRYIILVLATGVRTSVAEACGGRESTCSEVTSAARKGFAQVQKQASAVYAEPPQTAHLTADASRQFQWRQHHGQRPVEMKKYPTLALVETLALRAVEWSTSTYIWTFVIVIAVFIAVYVFLIRKKEPDCEDAATSQDAASSVNNLQPRTVTRLHVEEDEDPVVTNTMHYQIGGLTTWDVFTGYPGTVWDNKTLWQMMKRLMGVALLVASLEFFGAPDPVGMDPRSFDRIGTLLNVFVGLLLSFFLTTNVKRWIECVNSFISFFNSIKNLQHLLQSLGTNKEKADHIIRYCLLSARMCNYELQRKALPKSERAAAKAMMWEELEARECHFSKILPDERAALEDVEDASGLIFSWVMSLMGRMSQDGDLPEFKSGVYGRVVHYALTAKGGLGETKRTISVQMPFVYVHTVATIVQVNNLLSAVSLGLTLGATFGITMARLNKYTGLYSNLSPPTRPFIEDAQEVLVQLFKCFVAPVLYQAFFEIGVSIATPYSNDDGEIPTMKLLEDLERDIIEGSKLAEQPPAGAWQAPVFKK